MGHALIFSGRNLEVNNLISDFHLILSKEILILLFGVIELLLCKCKIIFQLFVFGGQVFDLGTQGCRFVL